MLALSRPMEPEGLGRSNATDQISDHEFHKQIDQLLRLPTAHGKITEIDPAIVACGWGDQNMEEICATELIKHLKSNVQDAKDHLLEVKCLQAFYANRDRSLEDSFKIGDCVMLSTLHH